MRCSNCGTEFEGRFCPACGQPAPQTIPPQTCPRCGASHTGNYCPNCGWPAGRPFQRAPSGPFNSFLTFGWSVGFILFLVYLLVGLAAFAFLIPAVVEGITANLCEDCVGAIFIVNPISGFQGILFSGQNLLIWFTALIVLLGVLFFYLVFFQRRRTLEALRLPSNKVGGKFRSSSIAIAVGQIFLALLFFDLVYFDLILPILGVIPETPDFIAELPSWYLSFSVFEAPFTEEVAFRVLMIGLPLALGSLVIRVIQSSSRPSGEPSKGLAYVASSLKHLWGGQVSSESTIPTKVFAAILILLTAAFFGFLHVLSWGVWWRFFDTFLGGIALGYLFVRRGLVAAILLHFAINAGSFFTLLPGSEDPGYILALNSFYILLGALGLGFLLFYLRELGILIRGPRRPSQRSMGVSLRPSSPQMREDLLFKVKCSNCGSTEALYKEGVLTCARCGRPL